MQQDRNYWAHFFLYDLESEPATTVVVLLYPMSDYRRPPRIRFDCNLWTPIFHYHTSFSIASYMPDYYFAGFHRILGLARLCKIAKKELHPHGLMVRLTQCPMILIPEPLHGIIICS
jgi:hypothetical protein